MRLIDGDVVILALAERGQSDNRFKWGETIRYATYEVQQIINEDMPTIDAVPVVRCKDCKYYDPLDNNRPFSCPLMGEVMKDDFCSKGERKGGVNDAVD